MYDRHNRGKSGKVRKKSKSIVGPVQNWKRKPAKVVK